MRDKKAILGEGILTIYRLVLIAFIALIVLGLAAVFYDYYVDVRGAEAQIMAKQVVNCLAPGGEIDLGKFDSFENKILEYCGFDEQETERIYVVINVTNSLEEEIKKLEDGDSGLEWVKEIYDEKDVTRYRPGFFNKSYNVFVLDEGKKEQGKIFVEVLISHEF